MAHSKVEHPTVNRARRDHRGLDGEALRENREVGQPELAGVSVQRVDRARGFEHADESREKEMSVNDSRYTINSRVGAHRFQPGWKLVVTSRWSTLAMSKLSTPFVAQNSVAPRRIASARFESVPEKTTMLAPILTRNWIARCPRPTTPTRLDHVEDGRAS